MIRTILVFACCIVVNACAAESKVWKRLDVSLGGLTTVKVLNMVAPSASPSGGSCGKETRI
jgi:hypothetical protein